MSPTDVWTPSLLENYYMSREYTKKEVRDKVLKHMKHLAKYWADQKGKTDLEKIEGAMFSTLVILDGGCSDIPGFDVVCRPHPSDKEYHQNEGIDWFPDGMIINDDVEMHHEFAQTME